MPSAKNKSFGYSAIDIANKIVAKVNEKKDQGETISNLKLQKLLYYVQGFFIAAYNKQLFKEPLEAWHYGPVVRSAYSHFNKFGRRDIDLDDNIKIVKFPEKEYENFFNAILREYGQFSAIKLMNMTHKELPWKSTFHENPGGIISPHLLKDYFSNQLA